MKTKQCRNSYIFTAAPDSFTSATIGWQSSDLALWGVKEGFKKSADNLVEIALQEGANNNIRVLDTYIFPIMYLYRQSLELGLKIIYNRCFGRIPATQHDLIRLWNIIYTEIVIDHIQNDVFLEKVKKYKNNFIKFSIDGIDFPKIKCVLSEIQQVDRNSDVWRYAVDKSSNPYFTCNKYIDYKNIKNLVEELFGVFDYLYTIISEYLSS